MIDVKVRWNTKCTDNKNYWRVIIDGKEYICEGVSLLVNSFTTQDIVWDSVRNENVEKHHISCKANEIIWDKNKIIVK